MHKTFQVRIKVYKLKLSKSSIKALYALEWYDLVVFTSKHAKEFFMQELHERQYKTPNAKQMKIVGPRHDLLKFSIAGKRILFPRSAIAPHDIIKKLRARGAIVRVLALYTTQGVTLTKQEKNDLLQHAYVKLYFRSPSGVQGFMQQFSLTERRALQQIPARCIGPMTAKAARAAGFVSVKRTDV
jgi:uroporphyrinogen-III synthase